jgi:uncharacterized protein YciI
VDAVAHLFVLDLTYVADLVEVERHMEGHREYLDAHYERGIFLASGRKVPRTGGVILATGTRGEIEEAIERDPFAANGVAEYKITEFLPTMTAPLLDLLRESL